MLKLIKYELRKHMISSLIILGELCACQAIVLYGYLAQSGLALGLGAILLVVSGFVGFAVAFILGIKAYSTELSSKSGILTFMTPTSTLSVILSKMIFSLIISGLLFIIFYGFLFWDYSIYYNTVGDEVSYIDMIKLILSISGIEIDQIIIAAVGTIITAIIYFFMVITLVYLAITFSATLLNASKLRGFLSFIFFIILYIVASIILNAIPALGDTANSYGEYFYNSLFKYLFELIVVIANVAGCASMLKHKVSL